MNICDLKIDNKLWLIQVYFTFHNNFFLDWKYFLTLQSYFIEIIMAFVCHYCGKSFTSAEKLRAHKAVHDETDT